MESHGTTHSAAAPRTTAQRAFGRQAEKRRGLNASRGGLTLQIRATGDCAAPRGCTSASEWPPTQRRCRQRDSQRICHCSILLGLFPGVKHDLGIQHRQDASQKPERLATLH
ncbi:hypothetical protein MRX96_042163 [Rhipicephalus microplus]